METLSSFDPAHTTRKSASLTDVYIAALPEDKVIGDTGCPERDREFFAIKNESVRREKFFIWKLLCYALENSFGKKAEEIAFKRDDHGGWSTDVAFISLSHSGSALAVAVSTEPVGIDIERVSKRGERLAERIMNSEEYKMHSSLPNEEKEENLIKTWTLKEAIFKSKSLSEFVPSSHDTTSSSALTKPELINGEQYLWSVATPISDKVRIFRGIDLSNADHTL